MAKLGRVEVSAAALRNALHSAQREVMVVRDVGGGIAVVPDVGASQSAPAVTAGVTIAKETSLRDYLRPFKPQTMIAIIPSRKLVGKAQGTSGVVARMRALAL